MALGEYTNGYLERKAGGRYEGELRIDGVDLSPIEGQYFQRDDKTYLWLKRKRILCYDAQTKTYVSHIRKPQWEVYMLKGMDDGVVAFKGEFAFLRFRYAITGVWDAVMGRDRGRLNLFVESLPRDEQTILNAINERKRTEGEER